MNRITQAAAAFEQQEEELRKRGYGVILDVPVVKRLAGISFLGVLDYVYDVERPSTRFEHTVGVAHLALRVADRLGFSATDTTVLVLANLFHDVGHAPFSHNSEPFLLENRNVYHQGLTTVLLRQVRQVASGQVILDALDMHYTDVRLTVLDLVIRRKCDSGALLDIFFSPINCDKIEGNDRTLRDLDMASISPSRMIDCFRESSGSVYIHRSSLPLIERFWNLEEDLYWRKIYTPSVFAAEAMITRAFGCVYNSPDDINRFINSTDKEVMSACESDDIAADLMKSVRHCDLVKPLSEIEPELFERFRERFKAVRFDKPKRAELENELARALGVERNAVISHFSRRKHFPTDMWHVMQGGLFEEDPDLIALAKVNQTFAARKVSGDLFEVFLRK